MKTFVIITLSIIILYLLFKNVEPLKAVFETVTRTFDDSFKAVTEVGDFK